MSWYRPKTNNGDLAAEFFTRLKNIRKMSGLKGEVAKLWGVPVPTVFSLEEQVHRALLTVARHADRLGVVITYDVSLPREDRRGKPLETPSL